MEQWKPVVGYEGLYEVSDIGNVKSLPRLITQFNGHKEIDYRTDGKIMTLVPINGYNVVRLSKNGKAKNELVHRLVLISHGRLPKKGEQCCHWDGTRSNNNLSNLRWGSAKENAADRTRHGTQHVMLGEDNHCAKLTEEDVRNIRSIREKDGLLQREIAEMYGLKRESIRDILNRKIWKHII